MLNFILVLLLFIFICLTFDLGGKYQVSCIKSDLSKNGVSVVKYGDYGKIKITGSWKEVK